eukprot:COSAG01_NODE_38_length_33931_cov_75.163632_13_plen_139_part_00
MAHTRVHNTGSTFGLCDRCTCLCTTCSCAAYGWTLWPPHRNVVVSWQQHGFQLLRLGQQPQPLRQRHHLRSEEHRTPLSQHGGVFGGCRVRARRLRNQPIGQKIVNLRLAQLQICSQGCSDRQRAALLEDSWMLRLER